MHPPLLAQIHGRHRRTAPSRARAPLWWVGLALCLSWALVSSSCVTDEDPFFGCIEGTVDCPCTDAGRCNDPTATCWEGICRVLPCTVGEEGCACFANETCGRTDSGERLRCDEGECVRPACIPGSAACACDNGTCRSGLLCVERSNGASCERPGCPPGAPGCTCRRDQTCDPRSDGLAMACIEGFCSDVDCLPGTLGCTCADGYACDEGWTCGGDGVCREASCVAGTIGCACAAGDACFGRGLVCESGRCAPPGCIDGALGCPCDDGTCEEGGDAERRVCIAGRCTSVACAPGELGCSCDDGTCVGPDRQCINDRCLPTACDEGTLACPCDSAGDCDAGLYCENGLRCADATGLPGGPCDTNGQCFAGSRCVADACVPCSVGGLGCSCRDDGLCNTGLLCDNGRCSVAPRQQPPVPDPPLCFTPCTRSIEAPDGTFQLCDGDGLLDGCVDGRTCRAGSCLLEGERPPTCGHDGECPDFQACIDGGCFSTCLYDSECGVGATCQRRVCRDRCVPGPGACPVGSYCDSTDGRSGVCAPRAESGTSAASALPIRFELSDTALEFDTARDRATFRIRNETAEGGRFVVRKRSHRFTAPDGTLRSAFDRGDGPACEPPSVCPLFWLQMGVGDTLDRVAELDVFIPSGGEVTITIADAGNVATTRWDGTLEVVTRGGARETIDLAWAESPSGRWVGSVLRFGAFREDQVRAWGRGNAPATDVPNALVRVWSNFRTGRVTREEFLAAIESMASGSWKNDRVQQQCAAVTGSALSACFPFTNADGVSVLSLDRRAVAVPDRPLEVPFVANLQDSFRLDVCGSGAAGRCLSGRIESSATLQYPGDPAMGVRLSGPPTSCDTEGAAGCILGVEALEARVVVGGRFQSTIACPSGARWEAVEFPWLSSQFFAGTLQREGRRIARECRDGQWPLAGSDAARANADWASTNPVPNGRPWVRELHLVDGMLLDQQTLFLLVEERSSSLLFTDETTSAWSLIVLERERQTLDEDAWVGNRVEAPTDGSERARVRCTPELEAVAQAPPRSDRDRWARTMAQAMIDGEVDNATRVPLDPRWSVHYLCEATGTFSGGPGNVSAPGAPLPCVSTCARDDRSGCRDGGVGSTSDVCAFATDCGACGLRFGGDDGEAMQACPPDSAVRYFLVDRTLVSDDTVREHPCQLDGTCGDTLALWSANRTYGLQEDPPWACAPYIDEDGRTVARESCDDDRRDLRWGRTFFTPQPGRRVLEPLAQAVDEAFRFRTSFTTADGARVGWVPEPCAPDARPDAFCFDAERIEQVADRIDCLMELYVDHEEVLPADTAERLRDALTGQLGARRVGVPGSTATGLQRGFEPMFGELLAVLADERAARAATARYDLAGTRVGTFDGRAMERDGIELSGVAGEEMRLLYEAAQLQSMVVDRFFRRVPAIARSVRGEGRSFITPSVVSLYLPQVVEAASDRAQVWAEIAIRYRDFERPELARRVVARTYASAWAEVAVLESLLDELLAAASPEESDAVRLLADQALQRYRRALRQLADVHRSVDSTMNPFGLPRDLLPLLPPGDEGEVTGFEETLARAQARTRQAGVLEQEALDEDRSFAEGQASFAQTLQANRVDFESQLGEICGTFQADVGADRRIYPAVSRYRDRSTTLVAGQDPCGTVGNGSLVEAMLRAEVALLELRRERTGLENARREIDLEIERIERQCELVFDRAAFVWGQRTEQRQLAEQIRQFDRIIDGIETYLVWHSKLAGFIKCKTGLDSDNCGITGLLFPAAVSAVTTGYGLYNAFSKDSAFERIAELRNSSARYEAESACGLLQAQGVVDVQERVLRAWEATSAVAIADIELRRAVAEIERLTNETVRLQFEWDEADALLLDVQAAWSDPNVRVYRTARIRAAERAYRRAAADAWRATRLFEYATSMSWRGAEELFLLRTARLGDRNLERYLLDLEDAWREARESGGIPERRVLRLSLRDDILRIPRTDDAGAPLSISERGRRLREHLRDPWNLDTQGRLRFSFNTSFGSLSPRTRGHRIRYVEAEWIGPAPTDGLARVALVQRGTGIVAGPGRTQNFYPLPELATVINVFFQGDRRFDPELYRSRRLAGRPVVNTRWDLVIDRVGEAVNRNLDFEGLTDLRLYVVYEDEPAEGTGR